MNTSFVTLALTLLLAAHYITQKKLLRSGLNTTPCTAQTNRLLLNGILLMIPAIWAVMLHRHPYGIWGGLLFIESTVCLSFARKLIKKGTRRKPANPST